MSHAVGDWRVVCSFRVCRANFRRHQGQCGWLLFQNLDSVSDFGTLSTCQRISLSPLAALSISSSYISLPAFTPTHINDSILLHQPRHSARDFACVLVLAFLVVRTGAVLTNLLSIDI